MQAFDSSKIVFHQGHFAKNTKFPERFLHSFFYKQLIFSTLPQTLLSYLEKNSPPPQIFFFTWVSSYEAICLSSIKRYVYISFKREWRTFGAWNVYFPSPTLCEKCPYSEFSGSYFPAFGLNVDQKNSECGQFSRSDSNLFNLWSFISPREIVKQLFRFLEICGAIV